MEKADIWKPSETVPFLLGAADPGGGNPSITRTMKMFAQSMNVVLSTALAVLLLETSQGDDAPALPVASTSSDSSISGTIYHEDRTTPFNTGWVRIYRWNDGVRKWNQFADVFADWKGKYAATSLPSGKYRVVFYDDYWGFSAQFYKNAGTFEDSTDIALDGVSSVSGINGWLGGDPKNGIISGRATGPDGYAPLASARVLAYRCDMDGLTWRMLQSTTTGGDGRYEFSGLPYGHYRIKFEDTQHGYPARFFPNAANMESAGELKISRDDPEHLWTDVSLGGGMPAHGSISGTVYGPDGTTPLAAVAVTFAPTSGDFSGNVSTDPSGRYRITSLPAGEYIIGFFDFRYGYPSEYHDNEPNMSDALPVTVREGEAVGSIDAVLGSAPPPVEDSTLRSLSLSAGVLKPEFSPGIENYSLNVENSIREIRVNPTPSLTTSKVWINGMGVTSGKASDPIPLAVGANTIRIAVIAKDDSRTTYTVVVNRKPSSNNFLRKLMIQGGVLKSEFDRSRTSYILVVPKSRKSIRVQPYSADRTATIRVAGKKLASGQISKPIPILPDQPAVKIVVTAQNGSKKTYSMRIRR
jgi:hypothetical protein